LASWPVAAVYIAKVSSNVEHLEDRSVARDALEMGVYLSIALIALIASFEGILDQREEVLLIWGSAIGLALAHVFAFRLAHIYEHGISPAEGWRSVAAMFVTATAVALLASIPYAISSSSASAASVSTWILLAFVGIMAYFAARSRGRSRLGRFAYALSTVVLAALISIVKYILTH
jgi:hypothetical protein